MIRAGLGFVRWGRVIALDTGYVLSGVSFNSNIFVGSVAQFFTSYFLRNECPVFFCATL